jgi:hypothetical protein
VTKPIDDWLLVLPPLQTPDRVVRITCAPPSADLPDTVTLEWLPYASKFMKHYYRRVSVTAATVGLQLSRYNIGGQSGVVPERWERFLYLGIPKPHPLPPELIAYNMMMEHTPHDSTL